MPLMLQVAHGVHHTSTTVNPGQRRELGLEHGRREERKPTKFKLLQDHQHHNSNNHQQSTEIQPSQDLQQQYSYNQPLQDLQQQLQLQINYFKTISSSLLTNST